MKKTTTKKFFSHIDKLEMLKGAKFEKDSVFALVYEFTNGEIGFLPEDREYAYIFNTKDEFLENWDNIYQDYTNETDLDIAYFVFKEFDTSKNVKEESIRIIGKIDSVLDQSSSSRNFSNIKDIGKKVDAYLNQEKNIHNQEAWVPIGFLIGEIICEQKECKWHFQKLDDVYIEFDVRNEDVFYGLWKAYSYYFESVKEKKGKFRFRYLLNSIIRNPEEINWFRTLQNELEN